MTDKTEKPELDDDEPLLSKAEIEEIKKEARKELRAEQKKAAKDALKKKELSRLRMEEGLVIGGVEDEIVSMAIDLAPYADGILINGQKYWHGTTFTGPRHIARTLSEMSQRTWKHQNEIDGKSLTNFYQMHRDTAVSAVKGIKSPPRMSMA